MSGLSCLDRPRSCAFPINGIYDSSTDPLGELPLEIQRTCSVSQKFFGLAVERYDLQKLMKEQLETATRRPEDIALLILHGGLEKELEGRDLHLDEEKFQQFNDFPKIKAPNIDDIRMSPKGYFEGVIDPQWIGYCENKKDFTPLHVAVIKNDINEIKKILQGSKETRKGLVSKKDDNGLTPLHWAAIMGFSEALREILEKVAPEDRLKSFFIEDNKGWSCLHWAIEREDENFINIIFDHLGHVEGFVLISHQYSLRDTLLHWAIRSNNKRIINIACETSLSISRSQLLQSTDSSGRNIFHIAASSLDAKNFSILLSFLNPTERLRALQIPDNFGQTPLHLAASRKDAKPDGTENILKIILQNIYPEDKQRYLRMQDSEGRTAFQYAIVYGTGKTSLDILIDEADNLLDLLMGTDFRRKTLFHCLFYDDDKESRLCKFKAIIEKIKKDYEAPIVKSYLKELFNAKDAEGRTFLHYVVMLADSDLLKIILDAFEDENELITYLRIKDKYNNTCLYYFSELSQDILNELRFGALKLFFEMIMNKISEKNRHEIFFCLNIYHFFAKINDEDRKRYLLMNLDEKGNSLFHLLVDVDKDVLLLDILELIDLQDDKEELLIKENHDKISVLKCMKNAGIKRANLGRLLSIFSGHDFLRVVSCELERSIM